MKSVSIYIPPLRERREDIPILIDKFTQEFVARNKIKFGGFTRESIETLVSLDWVGNVRELKNLIESIIVLERGNEVNNTALERHLPKSDVFYSTENERRFLPVRVGKTPEESERELILRALWEIKNDIVDLKNSIESNAAEKKLALPVPQYLPNRQSMMQASPMMARNLILRRWKNILSESLFKSFMAINDLLQAPSE